MNYVFTYATLLLFLNLYILPQQGTSWTVCLQLILYTVLTEQSLCSRNDFSYINEEVINNPDRQVKAYLYISHKVFLYLIKKTQKLIPEVIPSQCHINIGLFLSGYRFIIICI